MDATDKKPADVHVETVEAKEAEPLRSHWAHLTPGEARRKFWRSYLMSRSMCIGGMYVGFSIVAPGNVVANPGFIEVRPARTT
jgi:hypothetical protein